MPGARAEELDGFGGWKECFIEKGDRVTVHHVDGSDLYEGQVLRFKSDTKGPLVVVQSGDEVMETRPEWCEVQGGHDGP